MNPGHYHQPRFQPAPEQPQQPTRSIAEQLETSVPQEIIQAFVDGVFDNLAATQRVEPKPRRRGSVAAQGEVPAAAGPISPSEQPAFMGTLSINPGRISMGQWRVNPHAVARDMGILRR